MISVGRQPQSRIQEAPAADLRLDPQWCEAHATWQQRRRFLAAAQALIRIPAPGAEPLGHLLTEACWRGLVPPDNQEVVVLTALSQASGVYFFPSREWVSAFCRFIHLLGIRRVLEAGAGRGYLAAALAPLLARQGVAFKAVDNAQGEFESGLPRHPVVEQADALTALQDFSPDLVLYAWPPPGQSIGPLCRSAGVRYVLVLGEPGGGCTGAPTDWQRFRHHSVGILSRRGLGRSGCRQQAATVFFGSAHPHYRELPIEITWAFYEPTQ
jgi:hypothetical protein